MTTALAFVFVFGLLTIFHEVGHFVAAKLAGIRVEEFGIGFGPKIASVPRGETLYSLRLLPLGGFVKRAGEEGVAAPDDKRAFPNKSVFSRFTGIGAGPFMNFILAVLIFGIIFFIIGVPEKAPLIGDIVAGSPAQAAGLKPGDKVLSVDGEKIETWEQLVDVIQHNGTNELEFLVQRQEKEVIIYVTPVYQTESGTPYIGVQRIITRYKLFPASRQGLLHTIEIVTFIIARIIEMLTGKIAPEVAGPVGIVQVVGQVARTGFLNLLSLAAILSVNLALFNLFPIPMLDGGQLLFLSIEAIRGKPLEPEQEGIFKFIGILLLLLLLITVTYRDVTRLIL